MSQQCCGLPEETEIYRISDLEFISSCHSVLLAIKVTDHCFSPCLGHHIWVTRKATARVDVPKLSSVKNDISQQKTLKWKELGFTRFHLSEARQGHSPIRRACLFLQALGNSFQPGPSTAWDARTECVFTPRSSRMSNLVESSKRSGC